MKKLKVGKKINDRPSNKVKNFSSTFFRNYAKYKIGVKRFKILDRIQAVNPKFCTQ